MNILVVWIFYRYNLEELPKLGTGKADFKGAKKLAGELSDGRG